METQTVEYKSIKLITGGRYKDLAAECVAFANAQGGVIVVGFEDKIHPRSKSVEIQERINDISIEEIRRVLTQMEKNGSIKSESSKRFISITENIN